MSNSDLPHHRRCLTTTLLFWLCAVWTVIEMLLILGEYLHVKQIVLPHGMSIYYYLLLTIYVVVKEAGRWAHLALGRRRGELFFLAWWVFALALHLGCAITENRHTVPQETLANCIVISIVFVGSSFSKLLHYLVRVELRFHKNHRSSIKTHSS